MSIDGKCDGCGRILQRRDYEEGFCMECGWELKDE